VITSRREEEDMPEENRDLAGHELPRGVMNDDGLGSGDHDIASHERVLGSTGSADADHDSGSGDAQDANADVGQIPAADRMNGDLPVDEESRLTDGGNMGAEAAMTGHSMGVAAPTNDPADEGAEQMPPYEQSASSDN
jgi:hypothetical protein